MPGSSVLCFYWDGDLAVPAAFAKRRDAASADADAEARLNAARDV